ncbi:MAG: hypothetical protein AAF664_22550 [Planctomycetota bacterium]
MSLSRKQTQDLIDSVSSAKPDELDCDGCHELMAEFAELELSGKEIPEAMQAVRRHLDQCVCCNDEYNALLEALGGIEAS